MRVQSPLAAPWCASKRKKVPRKSFPLSPRFQTRRLDKRKHKPKVASTQDNLTNRKKKQVLVMNLHKRKSTILRLTRK
jgi:hypothetical protein